MAHSIRCAEIFACTMSSGWVEGFALEELDENNPKHKWASELMVNSIVTHTEGNIRGYTILKVYRVKNSLLYDLYRFTRDELSWEMNNDRVKEVHLFHGTTHAHEIVEQGFRADLAYSNAQFGKGIYFCDRSSKSNQYTYNGYRAACVEHKDVFCEICVRTILICRVALGKEYHTKKPQMKGITEAPKGFHCVIKDPATDCDYSEFVIFNNYQAYPGYLIEYTLRK